MVQLDSLIELFPMRQQQTGMYWLSIYPSRNYDKAYLEGRGLYPSFLVTLELTTLKKAAARG